MLNDPVLSRLRAPLPVTPHSALQRHAAEAFKLKLDASEGALMAELRESAREVDSAKAYRNLHAAIREWAGENGDAGPRLTQERANALQARLSNTHAQWPNADLSMLRSLVAQGIDRPLTTLMSELRNRIEDAAAVSAQRSIVIQQRLHTFQQISTAAAHLNASLNDAYKSVIQRL